MTNIIGRLDKKEKERTSVFKSDVFGLLLCHF